ncbi:MAG: tmk [Verrucomicrobiales bacterium]|nr:tmk [Verrucomicrobiales bacterium]
MAGLFVSFEGGEGSGKSTQIRLLEEKLQAFGRPVLHVREPGGTAIGEVIRHLLKHHPDNGGMTREAELLLFAASRAQLVRERILPFLAGSGIVLADRFMDSTTVYQGNGRDLPSDLVAAVNAFAVGGCHPHITFLLDLDASAGLIRARARQPGLRDRMEEADESFYHTVRQAYLDLAAGSPERFCVLDAALPPERLHVLIIETLTARGYGLLP